MHFPAPTVEGTLKLRKLWNHPNLSATFSNDHPVKSKTFKNRTQARSIWSYYIRTIKMGNNWYKYSKERKSRIKLYTTFQHKSYAINNHLQIQEDTSNKKSSREWVENRTMWNRHPNSGNNLNIKKNYIRNRLNCKVAKGKSTWLKIN